VDEEKGGMPARVRLPMAVTENMAGRQNGAYRVHIFGSYFDDLGLGFRQFILTRQKIPKQCLQMSIAEKSPRREFVLKLPLLREGARSRSRALGTH
jgi:hypothetical protein